MVSVAIIARDAGLLLDRCISSVKNLSDDIVVIIDDRATDNTKSIALKNKARVFVRKFDNFASQKNYAVSQTKHPWVLSLDADEWPEDRLIKEIGDIKDWEYGGFLIKRKNIIFGRVMKFTNWEPEADKHIWLYNQKVGKWIGDVHEEVVVSGQIGELMYCKMHENYISVEQFISKMNDYTNREEKALNPFFDFLRRYIWHLGFLDGWHGLFLSYLMFIYHLVVWVKLWNSNQLSQSG